MSVLFMFSCCSMEVLDIKINEVLEDPSENLKKLEDSLTAHVHSRFEEAYDAKADIRDRMITCLRYRKGVYTSEETALFKRYNLADIFMRLPDVKCSAAQDWLQDVLFPEGEVPFTCSPTPIPEITPEESDYVRAEYENKMLEEF